MKPITAIRSFARPVAVLTLAIACVLAVGLLGGAGTAAAQEREGGAGRIQGQILDARSGQPVSSAQVFLEGTEIGTISDLNGRYILRRVPAGTHDLVVQTLGYAKKTVTGVEVAAGAATNLNVTLETEAVAVGELKVSVQAERGSSAALLNRQKNAVAVTDGLGAMDISRAPDSDAAETAQRMTGVTVQKGKYVYVRGLGQRYSQTSLNGSPLPSPDPERSVVPLDLFPAGFLQSLRVQKTYTADEEGNFSGGSVEIETREFPSTFTAKFSVGSSYNTRSQFESGFLTYQGGGLDFLGFDDGARAMPAEVREAIGGIDGQGLPSAPEAREQLGEAFLGSLSNFAPRTGRTPANVDWSFSVGDRTQLFGDEFGYFVAGTYSNEYELRTDEIERKWRSSAFNPDLVGQEGRIAPNVAYEFNRGTQEVELGGIANFTWMPSPDDQLSLKTLYNRNAEDEARRFRGANREDLGGELVDERLRFIGRGLMWGQLSGEHQLTDEVRLEWRGAAARAERDEPGLRETIYKRPFTADPGDPFFLDNTGESARYLFSELTDDEVNGEVDLHLPLPWLGDGDATLQVGGMGRLRQRDFGVRRLRWQFFSGSTITSLDQALKPENIVGQVKRAGQFELVEITEPGDQYLADDQTLAGYAMVDLPVGEKLSVNAGVRVEDYSLDMSSRGDELSELTSTDVLPAVNLTYRLTPEMNLRAGASRTLDRPEFRELAPFQFTEAASLRQVFGNPQLQIAEIQNLDLRWEWFFGPSEMISLSAFYKHFDRPIEQVFIATASSGYSYQNAEEADLYGAELGLRKGLGFLGEPMDRFDLQGNVAVIESEVRVRTGGIFDPTNLKRDLEGQAPYSLNLGLTYTSPGQDTEGGVFFNVSGPTIVAAGGSGVPDIEEAPRPTLDFNLSQQLWADVAVKVKATNLLDSAHEWTQSMSGITRIQRRYRAGQTFSVSFTYGG